MLYQETTMILHWQNLTEKIFDRRRKLRIPHSATEILRQSHNQLYAEPLSNVWTLAPTKLATEIIHFERRKSILQINGLKPEIRKTFKPTDAEEFAIKIDASLKFLELAQNADMLVKPILLYYSCAHLCGVYTRAFINWKKDKPVHGLMCKHDPINTANTIIKFNDKGLFPRLVCTVFLIHRWPNVFSDLVTYSSKPTAHTAKGELLENFCKIEKGDPPKELKLDEIVNFDYGNYLKNARIRHDFHKFNGLPTSSFLLDVVSLFLASSLARYDVLGWRDILEGKKNSYIIHFEQVFERYEKFVFDKLLAMLEKPTLPFQNSFYPGLPSPFSHSHSRFDGNPDAQQ